MSLDLKFAAMTFPGENAGKFAGKLARIFAFVKEGCR